MISHLAPTLLKRAADFAVEVASKPTDQPNAPSDGNDRDFYSWAWIVALADFIILIPLFVLTNYTFEKVLPVFAITEDERPPAYEPLALDEEISAGSGSVSGVPPAAVPKPASAAVPTRPLHLDNAEPITSSLMATWRLLRSHGGFRSIFRGFSCYLFQSVIQVWLTLILANFLGPLFIFASLLAHLLLVQYSTAWVHIVMTPPSAQRFWRRLPPFKHTFSATWRPVALLWAFTTAAGGISFLFVLMFGLKHEKAGKWEMPRDSESWKYLIVYLVSITLRIFVVIPAYITLVRVQASLLPDDQETIIPFDRSFQGKVEPAVIGGTGYVSLRDAWDTFSKAAWRRLLVLYAQIYVVGMAVSFIVAAFLVPQFFLLSYSTKKSPQ